MAAPTRREARSFAREGAEALRRGEATAARELLSRAVAAGRGDATVLLGLALACRSLNDRPGAASAIDALLAIEPRNFRAQILKADQLAESGDQRAASAFYLNAVKSAPPPAQIPPEGLRELQRAQALCNRYAADFEGYLLGTLSSAGYSESRSSARFSESLDIIFGKKKIYVQEPRYYYFPGLPQIQFYERASFPWMDAIEAATDDIRTELRQVLNDEAAFEPYLQQDPNRPYKSQDGMLDNPDWGAFYLWKNGELIAENAARCPRTVEAVSKAPLTSFPNRSPSVLFSLLKPGARIPKHNGLINVRLICHLPLIVPENCGFRVGNDQREWVEGKCWAFDDTIEHEAWNDSSKTRVILLFEVKRPEISDEENRLIGELFKAIDSHGGGKPEWEI